MTSLVTLASNVSLIIRLSNNDRSGRKNRKRRRKSHLQKKIIEKMTAAHLLADWKADRLSRRQSGRASITLNQGDPKRFLERRVVTVFAHHVKWGKSNKLVILVAQAWRKWPCCPRGYGIKYWVIACYTASLGSIPAASKWYFSSWA